MKNLDEVAMKKIPYGRQTVTEEDIKEVEKVLRSDYLTTGPRLNEFEKTIAEYHGAKYGVAFSSGTAGLHAAYNSLQIPQGKGILTSPITFVASSNAAIYCGLKPGFVDIDPETNCIDINKIESAITEDTAVITPVAYAGYPVDLGSIHAIAEKHGCRVIYDAAHAIGSRRNGTFGMEYVDLAVLSFHPVKHVTTGEGGMVLTNDETLYNRLKLFRSHGITKDPQLLINNDGPWYYEMQSLGFNYRMTDIQAALGISQFSRINQNLLSRNKIAKAYNDAFSDLGFLETPPSLGFELLETGDAGKTENIHAYHLYTLHLCGAQERKAFYEYLHANGILAQIHYIPVHLQPYYRENFGFRKGDFPAAEKFYDGEISIPMYHNMPDENIEYVIEKIKEYSK
ncbi:MAG: UDP-4-amino-4,6-dideoxy-N-acetyl-beta-L-altrosamine transaminase [Anaerovoracaceae bacterium]